MVGMREVMSEQRRDLPRAATAKVCSGRTYIVTGSNCGLGFEAAKALVALGSQKVVMAVRNMQSGEKARAEIEEETGKRNVAEVWQLDLAEYESVKKFARMATEKLDRIDAVIENAGVAFAKWTMTEGHETCIKVNVLGTLLLGILLLPKLEESAKRFKIQPRLSFVSSETGFFNVCQAEGEKIKDAPAQKWNDEKIADIANVYPRSKLLLSLAVRELASLVPVTRSGVIINVVNPGMCKTNLSRNAGFIQSILFAVAKATIARSTEMGSRTLLHGAVVGPESHGCYLSACEVKENHVPDWVTNDEGRRLQKRVWDDIVKELESADPGCVNSVL